MASPHIRQLDHGDIETETVEDQTAINTIEDIGGVIKSSNYLTPRKWH